MNDLNQTRPEKRAIIYPRGDRSPPPPSSAPLPGGDRATSTRSTREPQQNGSQISEQGELLMKTKALQALKNIEQLQLQFGQEPFFSKVWNATLGKHLTRTEGAGDAITRLQRIENKIDAIRTRQPNEIPTITRTYAQAALSGTTQEQKRQVKANKQRKEMMIKVENKKEWNRLNGLPREILFDIIKACEHQATKGILGVRRSEERRVGKEYKVRGSQ